MSRAIKLLVLLLALVTISPAQAATEFIAVSYHDVRDDVVADYDPDQYAVATENLAAHFRWLNDHGYKPVSIAAILAARAGGTPLPEKAVLLTFDDGYRSHYTRVFPLLKAFNYPAVFSLVTNWMSQPAGARIQYGNEPKTREDFLSWEQVREMQSSGLAEFASHSHDLHKGVHANPQGNELPAAVARRFSDGQYEDNQAYLRRLREDLGNSIRILERELGFRPQVMTWPYGKFSVDSVGVARELGLDINLTLETGRGNLQELALIPRHLILANPTAANLAASLLLPERPSIVRAAHVDLDYLYDPDPAQQEVNLSLLLNRIRALEISHVFLQAFADPDANGAAASVYFPNRHMPVRADLFSRVAWQLKTRADVLVYAWMPILAFELPDPGQDRYVLESTHAGVRADPKSEPRLSPFDADNRKLVLDLYEDLAIHADFDGILFHDDGRLNEFEDASAPGQRELQALFGNSYSFRQLREDPDALRQWSRHKQQALTEFTGKLANHVRRWHPEIKTARNLFADTVLKPESESWLAQSIATAIETYDYVALMAMPYLENRDDAEAFLRTLAVKVTELPRGPQKVIFEFQTVDWRNGHEIHATEIARHMRRLQSLGIRHFAWYPDDFIAGKPALEPLREGASLADYTHRRR
ncbi:MAG: poly-beta-1,6-N-acetyl-D-glucosamine N-deacetylase PgaB [Gammaproteobacteria bacterium]|nr:poly-beta-1,6-N-acetyl-D-glucosamine N-deacetylase PgaB [Gammaproteobacteria bacterium]